MRRLTVTGVALAAVLAAAVSPARSVAAGSARTVRIGSMPVLPAGTVPLAAVASGQTMRLTVALAPRDPAALAAYAAAVSDPASAADRHYLTTAQFARRFAPDASTVARVRRSLHTDGLTTGPVGANGLSFSVTAPAGSIERAFAIAMERVSVPHVGAVEVASAAPAVPAAIAPDIEAIIGLDGLARMTGTPDRAPSVRSVRRPATVTSHRAHLTRAGPQPCAAASAAATAQTAYTDNQVAAAYSFAPLYAKDDFGRGITVALYELEPNAPSDVAAYQACYGTDASVSYDGVDGGAGSGAGSGEAALDIEQVIGFAPAAHVIVYQGPNTGNNAPGSGPYDLFATIIGDDKAQVVSTSWGECETAVGSSAAQAEGTLFEEAATQGQTIFSASGDDGSEDCDGTTATGAAQLAVDDPASQPFVTGVGGTSLTSVGPPPTETSWNSGGGLIGLTGVSGGAGAGGGGISSLWTMPAYQSGAPAADGVVQSDSSGSPCGAATGDCRQVPDVSANADPQHGYLIYYNGSASVPMTPVGWQATGGTSAAAPLWAALAAETDADPACAGSAIGFANPLLYRLAGDLNDITAGTNDFTGLGGGRYAAGPGYDMATGLGSPNASALAAGLCAGVLRIATPRTLRSYVGRSIAVPLTVSGGSGAPAIRVTGLPRGTSYSGVTRRITGRPRTAGRYAVTITASDGTGSRASSTFLLAVGALPSASALVVRRNSAGRDLLSVSITSGRDAPMLVGATIAVAPGIVLTARARRATTRLGLSGATLPSALIARAVRTHRRVVTVRFIDASGVQFSFRLTLRVR